jgi:uncharacterized membrane protein
MSMSDRVPPRGGSSRGLWTLVLVLLAPAIVVPLLVPLYAKEDPTLVGFPFFFWFQFLLIILVSAVTVVAYYLAKSADRARRDEERGRSS